MAILSNPTLDRTVSRLGLRRLEEALLCAPARHQDFRRVAQRFAEAAGADRAVPMLVRVVERDDGREPILGFAPGSRAPLQSPFGRSTARLDISVADAAGVQASMGIFGSVWGWKDTQVGDSLMIMARPVRFGSKLCLDNVEQLDNRYVGKVMPIYLGIQGRVAGNAMVGHVLDQDVDLALSSAVKAVCEACGLPEEQILEACEAPEQFADLEDLFAGLHAPATPEEGSAALAIAKRIACLAILSPKTRNRLEAMTRISNGFELAAHDMVNRGAGEFEGTAKSGATTSVFKLIPIRPRDLLENRIDLTVAIDQAEARDDLANRRFSQSRLFN